MKLICPKCAGPVAADDTNVKADTALCRACEEVFLLSRIMRDAQLAEGDVEKPPHGAWLRDDGVQTCVGATMRAGVAWFFVLFSVVWVSITTAVFVVIMTSGNASVFEMLFFIPFMIVGVVVSGVALMGLFGRTEVTIRGSEGTIFTGIGFLGRRRTFDAAAVTDVRIEYSGVESNNRPVEHIVIDTPSRPVKLGVTLSEKRKRYLALVLRRMLVTRR